MTAKESCGNEAGAEEGASKPKAPASLRGASAVASSAMPR